MEIALKKNQSFRLSVELIDRLKQLAKRQNRSLNNYVETVLLDAAYHYRFEGRWCYACCT